MKKTILFLLFLSVQTCCAVIYIYDRTRCYRRPQICLLRGVKKIEGKQPYTVECFNLKTEKGFELSAKRRFFYIVILSVEKGLLLFEFDRRVTMECYEEDYPATPKKYFLQIDPRVFAHHDECIRYKHCHCHTSKFCCLKAYEWDFADMPSSIWRGRYVGVVIFDGLTMYCV